MSVLTIVAGQAEPVLRSPCVAVTDFGPALNTLVADMTQTMAKAKGVGIAAPQVGRNLQLFVLAKEAFEQGQSGWRALKGPEINPREPLVVINPSVAFKTDDLATAEEGCLSIPGIYGHVPRVKKLVLSAVNLNNVPFKLSAKGFLARVIQHEFDHLQGVLISDRFVHKS